MGGPGELMNEEALSFGSTASLVGIVSNHKNHPADCARPGFIMLNSGVVHRVGPNRLSVNILRDMAALGYVGFRFDFSGIGDSMARSGAPATGGDLNSVERRWIAETQEAMDCVTANSGVERFILGGNCSGAYIALRTAMCDPRVTAVALINLQPKRTPVRYYLRSLVYKKFWRRIFQGTARIEWPSGIYLQYLANFRARLAGTKGEEGLRIPDLGNALHALSERGVNVLLVHCEWDRGYDYFKNIIRSKRRAAGVGTRLSVQFIPGMNHDFNILRGQEDLQRIIRNWAAGLEESE